MNKWLTLVLLLATSVALALNREGALGISTGHAEIVAMIEQAMSSLEPPRPG